MLALIIAICRCEPYSFIMGVTSNISITNPDEVIRSDILPANVAIFIIEKYEFEQITTNDQLSDWGAVGDLCQAYGKILEFSDVDSATFNIVDALASHSKTSLLIDSRKECACKIRHFNNGLVIVRVYDNEPNIVTEITENLPDDVALVFVASTPTLFN